MKRVKDTIYREIDKMHSYIRNLLLFILPMPGFKRSRKAILNSRNILLGSRKVILGSRKIFFGGRNVFFSSRDILFGSRKK
jgi:hypothetical protein